MNRALLIKSINESKWLLLACSAATFAFCWIRIWIVSQLDTSDFEGILEKLPFDLTRFIAVDFAWLITYPGRIAMTYDEFIVVLCVSVWAIARGSDCVSGELGRGTMEMLLAQPVSRLQILSTNVFVTVVGVGVLALASWVGIYVGIHTTNVTETVVPTWTIPVLGFEIPNYFAESEKVTVPTSDKVSAGLFVSGAISLFALGLLTAGFSTLMSSWDRYRWRTIGIVVGVFIVQIIIKLIGMASERFDWMLYLSVLTAYEPEALIKVADQLPRQSWNLFLYTPEGTISEPGPMSYYLILSSFGVAFYVGAAYVFCRRDLPAPL